MEEDQKEEIFQAPRQFETNQRLGRGSSFKKYILYIVAIIVVGLLVFGVLRFLNGSSSSKASSITPTPTIGEIPTDTPTPSEAGTPTPTEKPSATPKPSVNPVDRASGLDRSKLSLHVLNGNGTVGASKKAADLLEGLGYNVTEVTNADNFDYDKTVVQVTDTRSDYLALLKKDLSGNYTIGTASADLIGGANYQAVVIVGKQ